MSKDSDEHLRLPDHSCPRCGKVNTAAFNINDESLTAKPGDFSICIDCGTPGIFEEDMSVRLALPSEVAELPKETRDEIFRARMGIRKLNHDRQAAKSRWS